MNIEGFIPIAGGIIAFMVATGKLPAHPKDPERMADYRRKYGGAMKVLAVIVILFGMLQLLGILR